MDQLVYYGIKLNVWFCMYHCNEISSRPLRSWELVVPKKEVQKKLYIEGATFYVTSKMT